MKMSMRHMLLTAIMIIAVLAGSASAVVTIEGPDEIEVGTPAFYWITGVEGQSASFFPSDQLTVATMHLRDGHALFWARQAGTYRIQGIAVDWASQRFAIVQRVVVVREGDEPNPPTPAGLAGWAKRTAENLVTSPQRATEAKILAASLRAVATAARAGKYASTRIARESLRAANRSALGEAAPSWFPFSAAVDGKMEELATAGRLETIEQYATTWSEIADGLEAIE